MFDHNRFKDIENLLEKGRKNEALHLITEMQARYIALSDENSLLRMQVHEFEDMLYLSRNLIFDGSCYWLITKGVKQGPFCPHCYNRDGALIRLDEEKGQWRCITCGSVLGHHHVRPGQNILAPAPKIAKVVPM